MLTRALILVVFTISLISLDTEALLLLYCTVLPYCFFFFPPPVASIQQIKSLVAWGTRIHNWRWIPSLEIRSLSTFQLDFFFVNISSLLLLTPLSRLRGIYKVISCSSIGVISTTPEDSPVPDVEPPPKGPWLSTTYWLMHRLISGTLKKRQRLSATSSTI